MRNLLLHGVVGFTTSLSYLLQGVEEKPAAHLHGNGKHGTYSGGDKTISLSRSFPYRSVTLSFLGLLRRSCYPVERQC